jgi:hypothetical protein
MHTFHRAKTLATHRKLAAAEPHWDDLSFLQLLPAPVNLVLDGGVVEEAPLCPSSSIRYESCMGHKSGMHIRAANETLRQTSLNHWDTLVPICHA